MLSAHRGVVGDFDPVTSSPRGELLKSTGNTLSPCCCQSPGYVTIGQPGVAKQTWGDWDTPVTTSHPSVLTSIVLHHTGVGVRGFSKKYLLSLTTHSFWNCLFPIFPLKTYHHPRLMWLLHLLWNAKHILASDQNCNLLSNNSNTAGYWGWRKWVWSLSGKEKKLDWNQNSFYFLVCSDCSYLCQATSHHLYRPVLSHSGSCQLQ